MPPWQPPPPPPAPILSADGVQYRVEVHAEAQNACTIKTPIFWWLSSLSLGSIIAGTINGFFLTGWEWEWDGFQTGPTSCLTDSDARLSSWFLSQDARPRCRPVLNKHDPTQRLPIAALFLLSTFTVSPPQILDSIPKSSKLAGRCIQATLHVHSKESSFDSEFCKQQSTMTASKRLHHLRLKKSGQSVHKEKEDPFIDDL